MLSDFTLLLQETSPAGLKSPMPSHLESHPASEGGVVWVTGLPSAGKGRLIAALSESLAPLQIAVVAGVGPEEVSRETSPQSVVRVHAETDLEAMVETAALSGNRAAARAADLVVPVDWEPVRHSVQRVLEALIARGLVAAVERA